MATHNMPSVFPHCLCVLVLRIGSQQGALTPRTLAPVLCQVPVTVFVSHLVWSSEYHSQQAGISGKVTCISTKGLTCDWSISLFGA